MRLLLSLLLALAAPFATASPYHGTNEEDAIAHLKSNPVSEPTAAKDLLEAAMHKGWYDLSVKLLEIAATAGHDLSTTVHQTASKIRNRLQSLTDSLHTANQVARGIAPAFEWAQSPDSIFLNVKFAHKLDTPATLGCDPDKVLLANRTVSFRAVCKDKKKTFQLELELLNPIDEESSSWSMSSVGRATITLKKAANSTGSWNRLLKSSKKPGNMHVWWALKEKYEAENEAWDKQQKAAAKDAAAAAAAANATTAAADSSSDSASTLQQQLEKAQEGPLEKAAKELEAERDAALKASEKAEEEELRVLEAEGRVKKQPLEEQFKAQKAKLEAEYAADKARIDEETEGKKKELRKQKQQERQGIRSKYVPVLAELRSGSGSGGPSAAAGASSSDSEGAADAAAEGSKQEL